MSGPASLTNGDLESEIGMEEDSAESLGASAEDFAFCGPAASGFSSNPDALCSSFMAVVEVDGSS